jgi:hypothetical protein
VIGRARLPNDLSDVTEMKDEPKPTVGFAFARAEPWPTMESRLGALVSVVESRRAEHAVALRSSAGHSGASPYQLPITNHQSLIT